MVPKSLTDIIKKISPDSQVSNTTNDENGDVHEVYTNEEAGEYVETTYKGIKVCVRENYPYYNPQNDKVYHSKEEEVEELYQLSKDMNKSSLHESQDLLND